MFLSKDLFLFIMVTWRPELGEVGGRSGLSASWAGQAWALPRGGAGGGVPQGWDLPARLSVAPAPRLLNGEGRGLREAGLGSSSAESLLSIQPELGL